MTLRTLVLSGLRHHWRPHLALAIGIAVASAAVTGALLVGDSVRQSLRDLAILRLGPYQAAIAPSDRFFTAELGSRLSARVAALTAPPAHRWSFDALLSLPGIASSPDQTARANAVQVIGVPPGFPGSPAASPASSLSPGSVVLNSALAAQLGAKPGDEILLRMHKPSVLSRDVPITPQSGAISSLRLKVHGIATAAQLGNLSLRASQTPPLNAFVIRDELARAAGLDGKANLLLGSRAPGSDDTSTPAVDRLNEEVAQCWTLADLELQLQPAPGKGAVQLSSGRIFLEPPIGKAASLIAQTSQGQMRVEPILTYLVNLFRAGTNITPYSMVTAAGPPWTPPDLADNEIVVTDWLAEDLRLKAGDAVEATYFLPESAARLSEATNTFRVRQVVALGGVYDDRSLMPEFPGLAKAESTHEWDAGFPLVHKIRDKDEQYWKARRGTPKAFVSLKAGQRMWANRFGDVTALRISSAAQTNQARLQETFGRELLSQLKPADTGLTFQPVRALALKAAEQGQDFGQLFIGFSFFLIGGALVLVALLFQLAIEQRAEEAGTLLAVGFTARKVRWLFWLETLLPAVAGSIGGMLLGAAYAMLLIRGLTTIWRGAVGTSSLAFHVSGASLLAGAVASLIIAAATIALVCRRQARRPARDLLSSGQEEMTSTPGAIRRRTILTGLPAAILSLAAALGLLIGSFVSHTSAAGAFFGAGALLLLSGIAWSAVGLKVLNRSEAGARLSMPRLGLRGVSRRRRRSLAVIALLGCGAFLVTAIGAFKLDAGRDPWRRSGGTGGFAFVGQSTLPMLRDLNSAAGREFYGLDEATLAGTSFVPFRVQEGDDASCLNLNRAQQPRVLGVDPELLARRQAFDFIEVHRPSNPGWRLLEQPAAAGAGEPVPAVADRNSILWAMGRKVGDVLSLRDEQGSLFQVRLAGALANSIMQGNLVISEKEFVRRFPSVSGHRFFLIDAPTNRLAAVSATLTRAFEDIGLELTPAVRRLAAYNAVQNTYLNTFQVLGALGLLLGSLGLGVVVLRNVLERRAELAVLQAVGFTPASVRKLVLMEHAGLLCLGLFVGLISAAVAVLPALLYSSGERPYLSLGATLAAILCSGFVWTWLASRFALRGRLIAALRNE